MKNKILAGLLFVLVFCLAFTVSATTYNFGDVTLKNGSRGEAVMELQRFLNTNLNLGLVVDGKLGPKTISVIKKWQINNGLVPDGLIGTKTKLKMNTISSNKEILPYKQEKFPSSISSLLSKYNIDLSKLRKIEVSTDGSNSSIFTYDEKETGYTFNIQNNQVDELGITNVSFNILYNSLPLFGDSLGLHFRKDSVYALPIYLPNITISQTPKISKTEATKIIESKQISLKGIDPQLGYRNKNAGKGNMTENYVIAWKAEKNGAVVILDANTGDILYSFDGIYY